MGEHTHSDERKAVGMLLGAEWMDNFNMFAKDTRGATPDGLVHHWIEYFTATGEPIPYTVAQARIHETWRKWSNQQS